MIHKQVEDTNYKQSQWQQQGQKPLRDLPI